MFVRHQIFQAAELPDKSFVKLGFKVSITFWHDMRPIWLTSLSLQRPRILIMKCSTQASLLSRTWTILRRRTGTFSPRLRSGPLRALTSVLCVWHLSCNFLSFLIVHFGAKQQDGRKELPVCNRFYGDHQASAGTYACSERWCVSLPLFSSTLGQLFFFLSFPFPFLSFLSPPSRRSRFSAFGIWGPAHVRPAVPV